MPEEINAQESAAPVTVDWNIIDPTVIPESVVKGHPAFKQVLTETIERRQAIAQLKAQVEQLSAGSQGEKPAPVTPTIDPEIAALKQQIAELSSTLTGLTTNIGQDKEAAQIMSLQSTYHLSTEDITLLRSLPAEQREAIAKRLGAPTGATSPGAPGGPDTTLDSLRARIRAKVRGEQTTESPFDPGTQRNLGGNG